MRPLKTISVIVPVFNSEKLIQSCLDSIVGQRHPAHEIIVIDDASTDSTAEKVRAFKNVRLIIREKRGGVGAARSDGVSAASGEILAFLDADCKAPVDWLEKISREFESDVELGGLGGSYDEPNWHRSVPGILSRLEDEYYPLPPGGNVAFLKEAWDLRQPREQIFLYPNMAGGEDMLVWQEIGNLARLKIAPNLKVIHVRLGLREYVKQSFRRGTSGTISCLKRTSTNFLIYSFKGYGGRKLFLSSVALIFSILSVSFAMIHPAAGLSLMTIFLIAHMFLGHEFFGLLPKVSKQLPKTDEITWERKIFLRLLVSLRTVCWALAACCVLIREAGLRIRQMWRVKLSIIHFFLPWKISKLFFFVTSQCNARCQFCLNKSRLSDTRNQKELSFDEITLIARSFKRLPYVTLSGGEPFLRDNLADIVGVFFRESKAQWITIPTNGTQTKIILDQTMKILYECPGLFLTIRVSLDNLHEAHDISRGIPHAFNAMSETLKGLGAQRNRHHNLKVTIATCFTDTTKNHIRDIVQYCRKHFTYDHHDLYLLRPEGFTVGGSNRLLFESFMSAVIAIQKETKGRDALWSRVVQTFDILGNENGMCGKMERGNFSRCHAIRKFITLYEEGSVVPCEILKTRELGNIRNFDYNIYAMQRNAKDICKNMIIKNHCVCDWPCALQMNLLYEPLSFIHFLSRVLFSDLRKWRLHYG